MKEQKKATLLQSKVIIQENENVRDFDNEKVKRAVVHSRQDIVLLVSYANSITKILKDIRMILLITSILFAIYFWFNL
ncbi:hypothetical protein N9B85_00550 [bacterium]|nr:hypothetical protein [bacterium]